MSDSLNAFAEDADIEGLRDFALGTDRGAPPFFAGRREEIKKISRRLGAALRQWTRGEEGAWKGRTTLIQGAPGAGKTALLEHLAKTLPPGTAGLQVCRLESKLLFDPGYWISKIGASLVPKRWSEIRKSLTRSAGFDFGVPGFAGARGSVSSQKAGGIGYAAWGELELRLQTEKTIRPVLLLIDEVQNVPGEKDEPSPGAALLSIAHQAAENLPIFPVYGGLAWSSSRLSDLGLSRTSLGYVRVLEPLSRSECREAVAGFFDKFRVRGSEETKRRWADRVAAECQGWPQHLNSHLQALAGVLERDEVAGDLDARVLDARAGNASALAREVSESAAEKRESYYGERLKSPNLKSRRSLAAAAADFLSRRADSSILDLGEHLDEIEANATSRHQRLPKGMDGEDFANAMIRAGILHEDIEGRLSIPIPSFRQYLANRYAGTPDAGGIEDAKPSVLSS